MSRKTTEVKAKPLFTVTDTSRKITIKHFLDEILLNPRNYRSFETVGRKHWSSFKSIRAKLIELINITMKNNKDAKKIQEKIFRSKKAFKADKSLIQIMDLVNYLYGPNNYKSLVEFYREDKEFVKLCDTINELINQGTPVSKLKKYMKQYYIVLSGNTRVSVILDYYFRHEKEMNKDGSLKEKFAVVEIDYDYEELFNDDNIREHLSGLSLASITKIRNLFQIACDLLVIGDNTVRSEDINTKFLALGTIAQEMIDNYETLVKIDSLNKTVKNSDHFKVKLQLFSKMYNAAGIRLGELCEGLLYKEQIEAAENLRNSDIIKDSGFFKEDGKCDTTIAKYSTKVISNAIGRCCKVGPKQNFHISREIGEKVFGVDVSTGKFNHQDEYIKGMEFVVNQKQLANTPKAGSYVAKEIVKGFDGFDGHIKKGGHLEQKQIDDILNNATENAEEYAEKNSLTLLDELKLLLEENDDTVISKLDLYDWIAEKEKEAGLDA